MKYVFPGDEKLCGSGKMILLFFEQHDSEGNVKRIQVFYHR